MNRSVTNSFSSSSPQRLGGMLRRAQLLLLFALAAIQSGCAGYQTGNQILFRNDVRTVHVAIFESVSYRRFLGQRLTEAVIRKIELNTPYLVTPPETADSFIQGRIVRDTKRADGVNRSDEPRNIRVAWRVEFTWVDRAGNVLSHRKSIRIDEDENFVPEGGQSLTTAQQRLIEKISREIVGQMENPW